MIVLLSIPHSGTHFTQGLLDSIGVLHRQYHTRAHEIADLQYEAEKAVIPVRDPLLVYTSWHLRNEKQPDLMHALLKAYRAMELVEAWFETVNLRLDAQDRDAELRKVATFCGYPESDPINYEWKPVGNRKPDPTDYTIWEFISEGFEPGKKEEVLEALQPYRSKHGY